MKQTLGWKFLIFLLTFGTSMAQLPSAQVNFQVTSKLPILPQGTCSGVFFVTNNGKVPFVIVIDPKYIDGSIRLYREYDSVRQKIEDDVCGWRTQKEGRDWVVAAYSYCIDNNKKIRCLQPNESIEFSCSNLKFSGVGDLYKAEIYLGKGSWASVDISPPIGYVRKIDFSSHPSETNTFWYAKEGTNQYLYLKTSNQFNRIGEMKMGTKPKLTGDGVVFNSTDNATQKITRSTALQIIQKHEKAQNKNE